MPEQSIVLIFGTLLGISVTNIISNESLAFPLFGKIIYITIPALEILSGASGWKLFWQRILHNSDYLYFKV